ncbi:Porimin [Heterocephalus glaber]|uniref:Porimin n=1 Tax=Heterocephalus glaber TaxID=10181 RepID=G5C5L0_HETGA|nr:porimin [Heterocephalus glaber]EHB16821.1 Porimin [Heterocephalus glaber]
MDLGAWGAWATLLLGALQMLVLAGAAQPPESPNTEIPVPLHNSSGNLSVTMPSSNTSTSNSSSTVKPLTPVSLVSINVTAVNMKSTSKMATSGVSTNTTHTTSKSTTKAMSISQNRSQMSTPMMTTTHSSLVTLVTTTIHSKENRGSKFDTGSFVGGIVLTLGVLSILYIGCNMYYSRRGIRYRTIDEHDAII